MERTVPSSHSAHSHTPAHSGRALLAGAALSPGATGQLRYDSRLLVVEPFPWRGCTLVTSHLLPGTQFNCKRTSTGVHFEGSGLAAGCRPAAILAVNEELPDLLSHRNVVNHHGQFGIVHGALLCQVRKQKRERESARADTLQEILFFCVLWPKQPTPRWVAMEQATNIHTRSASHYLWFVLGLGEKLQFMLIHDNLS